MSVKSPSSPRRALAGLGGAVAGLVLLAGPASACDLSLAETPDTVRIEYNPFAPGPSSGALNLALRNAGDTGCAVRLALIDDVGDPLPGVVVGGVAVEFRPREASGLARRDADPGVFALQLGPDALVRAELDAAVVRDAVVEAGEHAVEFRAVVQDADGQALLAPIPLRLVLLSTPRAQLNIAGAAGAYGSGSSVEVIDFGEAEMGTTRRAFLQIRANTDATVTVQSEHHGVMRRLEQGDAVPGVPYGLQLDGVPVDLAALWTREVDPPRTLEGTSLPLDFTLGEVKTQMSGKYQDLVTINIAPH